MFIKNLNKREIVHNFHAPRCGQVDPSALKLQNVRKFEYLLVEIRGIYFIRAINERDFLEHSQRCVKTYFTLSVTKRMHSYGNMK